jgi:hypothetical protein
VGFTFIIIDVGERIFSGQTFEVTVCENAHLMVRALGICADKRIISSYSED